MPGSQVGLFSKEYTTRRYALLWVSIWLALIFVTWFSRPLIPYQETMLAAVSWESYASEFYRYPILNGEYVANVFPLVPWIEVGIWQLTGASEFSLRAVMSIFSIGVLFLTGWAAYQLWPDKRYVRGNAPFILVGSLVWTLFATANISQVWLVFFLVFAINFLIRVWRFNEERWWIGFTLSVMAGLFASGLYFICLVIPMLLLAPFWADKKRVARIYMAGVLSMLVALTPFFIWALRVSDALMGDQSLWTIMGGRGIISGIYSPNPFYITLLNIGAVLFPWVFWLKLYRFRKSVASDPELKFSYLWFLSTLLMLMLLGSTSLVELFALYPALCLIVARHYVQGYNERRDILFIVLVIALIGLLLILIPLNHEFFELPDWTKNVSVWWGAGLILFSVTLLVSANDTRVFTLMLMSVALTLAINFGIVRQAADFYDLEPAGERVSWYQSRGFKMAHLGNYPGHIHFVGRLTEPLTAIHSVEMYQKFKEENPEARMIMYISEIDDQLRERIEYWQPFRGRYLVIAPISEVKPYAR